jgi:hypothetical protein
LSEPKKPKQHRHLNWKPANNRTVESFFDVTIAGIDELWWPKKEDFEEIWPQLDKDRKALVRAAIDANTVGNIVDNTGLSTQLVVKRIKDCPLVVKAILIAKMCQLPSDTARTIYIETLMKNAYSREYHYKEIQKIIKTDRDHLKEMAGKLDISGDGKRDILKEIAAYGMQIKKVEEAVIDADSGVEVKPAVFALADARMAFNAVQELNRMDHEYGQDDKATSSIEGQADRIRRLRKRMNKEAEKQAKVVGGVAKMVSNRELVNGR